MLKNVRMPKVAFLTSTNTSHLYWYWMISLFLKRSKRKKTFVCNTFVTSSYFGPMLLGYSSKITNDSGIFVKYAISLRTYSFPFSESAEHIKQSNVLSALCGHCVQKKAYHQWKYACNSAGSKKLNTDTNEKRKRGKKIDISEKATHKAKMG